MNIVIRLLTCLFLKQSAWVWSSIFAALLFVRLLESTPVTFSENVLKALATTLDHVIHKQSLMHVQRKMFFQSRDFVISVINSFSKSWKVPSPQIDYVRICTTNLREYVMSGLKIFKIFSNTGTLFSCLVILILLNRDAFFKIYRHIA